MNPAKGQIDRLPDHRLLGIGHHHRALEMVGMDLVEGRADTGVVHDSHRPLVEPDVFADDTPRAVIFGDDVAGEIVDVMAGLAGTRHIALRQAREVIVEIFGAELAAQHHDVQLAGVRQINTVFVYLHEHTNVGACRNGSRTANLFQTSIFLQKLAHLCIAVP